MKQFNFACSHFEMTISYLWLVISDVLLK